MEQPIFDVDTMKLESFDFLKIVFERLEGRLYAGVSLGEFCRLLGLLYSLNKNQSKLVLILLRRQYGVKVSAGWIWIE